MSFDIQTERGVTIASFDNDADADRFIAAVELIEKTKAQAKLRKNHAAGGIDHLLTHDDLASIPFAREILEKLNFAIVGSADFKLTDRVIPLVKFFFTSNSVEPSDDFFIFFAMFTSKQQRAMINYFRTLESSKNGFSKCPDHAKMHALSMFWIASHITNDLDQFLKLRAECCEDVFFLKPVPKGYQHIDASAAAAEDSRFFNRTITPSLRTALQADLICSGVFKDLYELTQGFRFSIAAVQTATSLFPMFAEFRDAEGKDSDTPINNLCKRLMYAHSEEGLDFGVRDPQILNYSAFENYVLNKTMLSSASQITFRPVSRFLSSAYNSERFTFHFAVREFLESLRKRHAPAFLKCTKLSAKIEFIEAINLVKNNTEEKAALAPFLAIEDITVVELAAYFLYVIDVLSRSGDAIEKISNTRFVTLQRAFDICIESFTGIFKPSAKEIYEIYIENLQKSTPTHTLLEIYWPLLQETVRSSPQSLSHVISDSFVVKDYINFLEEILPIAGRVLAAGPFCSEFFECGFQMFINLLDRRDYGTQSDHNKLFNFDTEIAAAKQKHLRDVDFSKVVKGFLTPFFIRVFDFRIHYDFLHTSRVFKVFSIESRIVKSEDSRLSLILLPQKHPLNLFVGHEKISNCCMFPGSAGFSCNIDAFDKSMVTPESMGYEKPKPTGSHIVVCYDHQNEAFVGSAWVYLIGSVLFVNPEDHDEVSEYKLYDTLPLVYQIDEFEITSQYTDVNHPNREDNLLAVKGFVELCIEQHRCANSDGVVIVHKGGFTDDTVVDVLDTIMESIKYTYFETNHVAFGFKDFEVYSDAQPTTDNDDTELRIVFYNSTKAQIIDKCDAILKRVRDNEQMCDRCLELADFQDTPFFSNTICSECVDRCSSCSKMFDAQEEGMSTDDGELLCDNCFTRCVGCGSVFDINYNSLQTTKDGKELCPECVISCYECGEALDPDEKREYIKFEGDVYCTDCYDSCKQCDKDLPKAVLNKDTICEDCENSEDDEDGQ